MGNGGKIWGTNGKILGTCWDLSGNMRKYGENMRNTHGKYGNILLGRGWENIWKMIWEDHGALPSFQQELLTFPRGVDQENCLETFGGFLKMYPQNKGSTRKSGWWYTNRSEKYDFVGWDDYCIPYIVENRNVPNHQSVIICYIYCYIYISIIAVFF